MCLLVILEKILIIKSKDYLHMFTKQYNFYPLLICKKAVLIFVYFWWTNLWYIWCWVSWMPLNMPHVLCLMQHNNVWWDCDETEKDESNCSFLGDKKQAFRNRSEIIKTFGWKSFIFNYMTCSQCQNKYFIVVITKLHFSWVYTINSTNINEY